MTIALIALALDATAEVRLEFWPDLGTRVAYERTMKWSGAEDTSYEVVDRLEGRVSQRDSRGEVTIEWVQTPMSASLDGTALQKPKGSAISFKERRMRNGAITYRQEWPQDSFDWLRYAGIMNFVFPSDPVKPGSKWKMEWLEEQDCGLPAATTQFRFVDWADPDQKTAKCTVGFEEKNRQDAMRGHGEALLNVKTGFLQTLKLNVESAIVPGDEERERMKLVISLKSLDAASR